MAELKWTNINDSGANTALGNYLDANREFRKSVVGIGSTLSDFTNTLQKGDAENNQRIRNDVTNAIINRANSIQSQEDMDKYLASGALDNDPLRQQYGWFIDMDKINQAKANLPKNVLERAQTIDNALDYNEQQKQAQIAFNKAIASGNLDEAKKLQEQFNGSLKTSGAMASDVIKRNDVLFDRQKDGLTTAADISTKLTNANIKVNEAYDQLATVEQQTQGVIANIEQMNKGLSYKDDPNNIKFAQVNEMLRQAREQVNLAVSNAQQYATLGKNMSKLYGYKSDASVYNPTNQLTNGQAVLQKAKEQQLRQPVNTSINDTVRQGGQPTTDMPNSKQELSIADIRKADDGQLYDYSLNKNKIEDKDNIVDVALKGENARNNVTKLRQDSVTQLNQVDSSNPVYEIAEKYLNDPSIMTKEQFWTKLHKDYPMEALSLESIKPIIEDRFRTRSVTDGKVSFGEEYNQRVKDYDTFHTEARQNLVAKSEIGSNKETQNIIGLAMTTPEKNFKVTGLSGREYQVIDSTSAKAKQSNLNTMTIAFQKLFGEQGFMDGSGKWYSLDGFKKEVKEALDNNADPKLVFGAIQTMGDLAQNEEIDSTVFSDVLKTLTKQRAHIANVKTKLTDSLKAINASAKNQANKFIATSEGQNTRDQLKALNIDFSDYNGRAGLTPQQEADNKLAMNSIKEALFGKGLEYTDKALAYNQMMNDPTYVYNRGIATNEHIKRIMENPDDNLKRLINKIMRDGSDEDTKQLQEWLKPFAEYQASKKK